MKLVELLLLCRIIYKHTKSLWPFIVDCACAFLLDHDLEQEAQNLQLKILRFGKERSFQEKGKSAVI